MALRRGWRPLLVTAALGLAINSVAMAQSAPPPPPPQPPPLPPVPNAPPPKVQNQDKRSQAEEWRDPLADWMLWEGVGELAVGHVISDPLTTGFGNPDYLEPASRPSSDRANKRTASIDKPQ